MSKDDIQHYSEQDLRELAIFWRRFINELEIKNPQDVLPEMRVALADTQACLDDLKSVGC